jgi:hypothetical protein
MAAERPTEPTARPTAEPADDRPDEREVERAAEVAADVAATNRDPQTTREAVELALEDEDLADAGGEVGDTID